MNRNKLNVYACGKHTNRFSSAVKGWFRAIIVYR